MRMTTLLPVLFLIATAHLESGCRNTEDVTSPGTTRVDDSSQQFRAALQTEIESDNDAPASKGDTRPQASSSSTTTGITSPTVIDKPGFYRVTSDFTAAGDGIVIRSDWVWLNLHGHTITGPGNKSGRGIVLDNVEHVLVTGGTLETFGIGVVADGTAYSCVRRLQVVGGDEFADPANGIPPQIGIMFVNSYRNRIRHNTFSDVNLGIFVRGGDSFENRIWKNDVTAGANGLLGICYNPAMGEGPAGPRHDVVTRNFLCGFGGGIQTSEESAENEFRRNTIRYLGFAYQDLNGSNVFSKNHATQITAGDGCDAGDDEDDD